MTYSVAIAGASGYAGGEVLRLLAGHPEFEVRTVTAHSNAGQRLVDVQPHLRSYGDLMLGDTTAENLAGHDVVFLALPHGSSGAIAAQLSEQALVIDCGADHRLEDEEDWTTFYGGEFNSAWTYGIPELPLSTGSQRDYLTGTTRIAAPGCNASAISLAIAPGVKAGLIDAIDIVSVLSVGPSGAGKSLKVNLLASEIMGSASAYSVGGTHRHTPEIEQNLRKAGAAEVSVSMTPVLVPMARGILATTTARVKPGVSLEQLHAAWTSTYADEPFVQVLPVGEFPRTADTIGANTCLMGIALDEHTGRVVVVSALDNLTKGTAGAAIQSANIALGLPETTGLTTNGVAP
ncbi:N-acetyl-gamma-glutamyl-phosphate reductase [Aurantimicrobium minutum]|uniref:N-acetyl-gamma-glutamyl-phosphate reductase n=1 Tax=Aurantimicrobium minutum TaxID=708131 RepID=UPI00247496D4|nr:N-acetyl-gamma-glutamyl-phosphate reductase [Aurantimicrobium minutum]MDH6532784.1 N-acetyl-gamma-glutamyl-phosphate reductase [Aurantimicrobium minutum]